MASKGGGLSIFFTLFLIALIIGISYYFYENNGSFLDNLTWRRAVKHFSPGFVDTEPIKTAILNSPSSFGLQPYNVIVVTNPEIKKKLSEVCFKQPQIEECYALFIFCAYRDIEPRMEEYIQRTKAEHLRPNMTRFFENCEDQLGWAKNQVYIALGFALAAAAQKRISSCPMEGFIHSKVSEILGLNEDIEPCVLLAVGNEGDNSKLPPRFRFSKEEVLFEL